jgi:tRNA nucleotidyltransferase/poly(A) polymerase
MGSAAVASLTRSRSVKALSRLARSRKLGAWLVGGALRDALLGIRAPDVDVAVSRDSESLARELEAAGFGRAVVLSERDPRVVRVAGKIALDLADLEGGSIAADLSRRDFTANAVAVDLSTGEWVDPFGGRRDIAARRLRIVREENLAQDPLRTLRAARFLATHRLKPDRSTERACRRYSPMLSGVAPERIGAELSKLLGAEKAAPAFDWARRAGLLPAALGLSIGSRALLAAARTLRRLDLRLRGHAPLQRRMIRLAAIADAAGLDASGTASWLRHRRFGRADAVSAASLVALVRTVPSDTSARSADWTWLYDAGAHAEGALTLLPALRPGKRFAARRIARRRRQARRGPRITGDEVMRWSGLPPGRRIGEILREIGIEGLAGRIGTKAQARRWLSGRLSQRLEATRSEVPKES